MNEIPTGEDLVKLIRNRATLVWIGETVIAIIKARTLRGEFLDGSSPSARKYSTTPMPLPFSVLKKTQQGRVWARLKKGEEEIRIFTNRKSGITWVILTGGYKRLRELAGKEVDHVTLNWSGSMMRALKITNLDEGAGTVTVSFSDYRAAQIAGYHYAGAGKSRKKRRFVGLTAEEGKLLGDNLMKNLNLKF